jgi:hypothetical protein
MRVRHDATYVAIAVSLTLPTADKRLHQPHSHSPSPRDIVTFIGTPEIVKSSTSAARTTRSTAPEVRYAAHLR